MMPSRLAATVALLAALAMAALCVRLGFWQLSRLEQKRALNRTLRRALATPVLDLTALPAAPESLAHRRVRARGAYDAGRQVLVRARSRQGSPGVEVLTPLRIEGAGEAVLVRRGWLPAADAATARPQDYPEPGIVTVVGMAEPAPPAGAGGRVRRLAAPEGEELLSTRDVALDSLRPYFPYPLAGFTLRQLPDAGLPAWPARLAPQPLDESMHLSYAVQWFSFAVIIAVGSLVLAFRSPKRGSDPRGGG